MQFRLNPIYKLGAYGSVLCLCLICGLITLQVVGRLIDKLLLSLGHDSLGLEIPGLSEASGFLLVGVSFLGLAYTFVNGGHIRVTLLIGRLGPKARAFVELGCLSIALALCSYLAWNSFWLVEDSLAFDEVSYGILRVPLWIPQAAMLSGIVLFCLSLLEAWLDVLVTALLRPSTFQANDTGHE
ncbi:TRAP transporter small permease [Zobellella aerophila]|uniref:TRAP transporter small permease protein n=1 Tax=Zobellella aerophila TaxID=870480 RepID=A0ABP6WGY3_9GAMM